jgi:hypothetical protein
MTAYCLLLGSPAIGWYSDVVVLDVVRGEPVFYYLMFNIMLMFTCGYASVGLTVTIRKNCLYSPLGVGDAFDNLPNGHIMRGVNMCTEGTNVLGGANGYIRFCSRRVRNGLK